MIVSDYLEGVVSGAVLVGLISLYWHAVEVVHAYDLGVRHGKEQSAWAAFIVANKLADKEL